MRNLDKLIAKGKEQGYLTYADFKEHIPRGEIDIDELEDTVALIGDMGIAVGKVAPDYDDFLALNDSFSNQDKDKDRDKAASLAPAPYFGRPWEHKHALIAGAGSLLLCTIYAIVGSRITPNFTPGVVEFLGTTTSLWSVWLTQKRNVLALPIGIVSVILMGWFFKSIDLNGQVLLHWMYYLPMHFCAWHHWSRGSDEGGELRVRDLSWNQWLLCIGAIAITTIVLGKVLDTAWQNSLYIYWDASIAAASVVAMILLATKRVESWILWILPVNVSAIILYTLTGAYMFAVLYCLFLVMAFVGLARWTEASRSNIA